MTLGELIRDYRTTHSLSMAKFSELSGISKGYISMLENNKTHRGDKPSPSVDVYRSVAAAMGMDLESLIRTVDGKITLGETGLPGNLTSLPDRSQRETVPLVGRIACGTPILAEENIEDYVELPGHVRADYALLCKGESMINAGIRDGDVVYIRQQAEVANGQIAAVMVDGGDATLKRFYLSENQNTVTLVAENPAVPPLTFTGEDINRQRVLGLAVAYVHLLK